MTFLYGCRASTHVSDQSSNLVEADGANARSGFRLWAQYGGTVITVPPGSEPTTLLPLRFLCRWAAQRAGQSEPLPRITSLLDLNDAWRSVLEGALGYELEVATGAYGLGEAMGCEPSGMERLMAGDVGVIYTAERGAGLCLFQVERGRVVFDPQSTALPQHLGDLLSRQRHSPLWGARLEAMALVVDRFVRGNMYHEVCDHLLRAYRQQRAWAEDQRGLSTSQHDQLTPMAFATTAWPYSRFLIQRLIACPVHFLEPGVIYSCDTLLYWSNMARVNSPGCSRDSSYLYALRSAVEERRTLSEKSAGIESLGIYFSRQNSANRKLAQEPQLAEALEERGLRVVCMERLSPQQQIAVVRSASLIVAPHGAALTNVLFASACCRVVELLPEPRAHYATLCQALDLPYRGVELAQAEGKDGRTIAGELLEAARGLG